MNPSDRPSLRVVAYTDARGRGGAEISLGHLLASLPEEVRPTVVGVDAGVVGWLAERRPGAESLLLPDGAGALAAHLRAFRRHRPDVVHLNRCVPWACATATAAALLTPRTRVVTVDQLPLRTTRAGVLWRTRALTLRLDAAVAVGAASARRMEDFYALGRGSVHSIPNGVPDLPPPPRAPRTGPLHLVSVGRLDPVKGHDVLLRALAHVEGARLTILGEGDDRARLAALARELGIGERVAMPGWAEAPRERLADFDAFVLASRTEGFPLALVEAMLARMPVVATAVGSVPEAVADGETGVLVPPDDPEALAAAIRRLRDDDALRRRLAAAARAAAATRMTADVMAAAYLRLWRELRSRPRAPRLRPPTPKP